MVYVGVQGNDTHTKAFTHARTHTYTHTHTQTHKHTNTQAHKHTSTQAHSHTHTRTHTHTHTYTHTHTNTHIHTHTQEELVQDMLYGGFKGNDATRWGSEKEAVALGEYITRKRSEFAASGLDQDAFQVTQSGLHVCVEAGWLAASPDGHVQEGPQKGLLEIKCPFSKRIYPSIPDYYVDQVQGLCAILGYEWADFVVWTPKEMKVERVAFDRDYWLTELRPSLVSFYRDLFLPAYADMCLSQPDHEISPSPAGQGKGTTGRGGGGEGVFSSGRTAVATPRRTGNASTKTKTNSSLSTRSTGTNALYSDTLQASALPNKPEPSTSSTRTQARATGTTSTPITRDATNLVSTIYVGAAPAPSTRGRQLRPPEGRGGVGGGRTGSSVSGLVGEGLSLDADTHLRLVQVVREVDEELTARGRALEFVGNGPDSFFVGLALQLARHGRLPLAITTQSAASAAGDDANSAACNAQLLRRELVRHMAAHHSHYMSVTGLDMAGFQARLTALASQQQVVGGPELAAAASIFNVSISCFLISAKGKDERCFAPPPPSELLMVEQGEGVAKDEEGGTDGVEGTNGMEEEVGGREEGAKLCFVTAGSFFWSTVVDGGSLAEDRRKSRGGGVSSNECGDGAGSGNVDLGTAKTDGHDTAAAAVESTATAAITLKDTHAAQEDEAPRRGRPRKSELAMRPVEETLANTAMLTETEMETDTTIETETAIVTPTHTRSKKEITTETGTMEETATAAATIVAAVDEGGAMTQNLEVDVSAWEGYGEAKVVTKVRTPAFESRYSPVFQKCIVDVEAKFAADGIAPPPFPPSPSSSSQSRTHTS